MNSFVIYSYNDMVFSLLKMWGNYSSEIDRVIRSISIEVEFGEYLTKFLIQIFSKNLPMPLSLNILILVNLLMCIFFSYLLFFKILKSKAFSFQFTFLFSTSIYILYRYISYTPALFGAWSIIFLIWILVSKRNFLFVGLLVCLIFSISVYYAFFSLVILFMWFFVDLFYFKQKINFSKKYLLTLLIPVFFITFIFRNSLVQNIPIIGNYEKPEGKWVEKDRATIYRPIDDWYNLSFRPWYFFIPPKSSIFFGDLSKNIHSKIESTGYYLADDYMEEEMAGSYMGWHFLLGLLVVAILLILKKYKNKEFPVFKSVYENKEMILRSFFIIFCILLISGPPSFTIRGIEIYTPTYLLYYIVPVFRTLVRWAVVIYLFVLIINSFLVQDLYNLMKNKFQKALFIVSFLALNFVIFAIKIPVININKPPQEIAYVKETYPESVPYAVYPKGDYYSIFWIISHEDLLINPVNYVNYDTGFDANEFSKNLVSKEGLELFRSYSPNYLIYYPNNMLSDYVKVTTKLDKTILLKADVEKFFTENLGKPVQFGEALIYQIPNY